MGVTAYEPNRVHIVDDIWLATDREEALQHRVAAALRRHRAFTAFTQLAERSAGTVTLSAYARELPSVFPAVEVADTTWLTYARAFVQWFEYAGLVRVAGQMVTLVAEDEGSSTVRLLGIRPPVRVKGAFPLEPPGPALDLLLEVVHGNPLASSLTRRQARGLRELVALGAVGANADGTVRLARTDLLRNGVVDPSVLRELLEHQVGCANALALLEADPTAAPQRVGEVIRAAYGAEWSPATTHSAGKYMRGWARHVGVATAIRRAAASAN
jgi:hypothetical protein